MRPVDFGTLILLGALWGGSYLFIKIGAPEFGPVAFMGGRVAIAALVLWAVVRAFGNGFSLRPYWRRLLVLGFINAALPFTLIAAAELELTASLVAVLGATVPLFVALLGIVWLRERVTAMRGAGLVLGLVGVAILTGWSPIALDKSTSLSIGATLLASLSYATSGIYIKRQLHGIPAPSLALGQQLGALAWLAVPATLLWPAATPALSAIGALAALAVLSTALAFVLFFRVIARIGPTRTATVTYIAPAFGMLGGAIFLGEPITGGMLAGFGIIAISMLMVNRPAGTRVLSREDPLSRSPRAA